MESPLKITIKDGFEKCFTEVDIDDTLELVNPNHLKVYCLDINASKFNYEQLIYFIKRNIHSYVFSRSTVNRYVENNDATILGLDAVRYLRCIKSGEDNGAGAELGEILLYIFLEAVLEAPKLLSKLEVKTSQNQYIYGADAVHILPLNLGNKPAYQLIIGEAKTYGDLKKAVKSAFNSIASLDIQQDICLLEKEILDKHFDQETTELISKLIIPEERDKSISLDTAYSIFIGYSIGLPENIPNLEYHNKVMDQISLDINKLTPYIMDKIKEYNLENHSFYIYILPFNDVSKDRVEIMKRIRSM